MRATFLALMLPLLSAVLSGTSGSARDTGGLHDVAEAAAVIQATDGPVPVTHTWQRERMKRVVINPVALTLRPIREDPWPR